MFLEFPVLKAYRESNKSFQYGFVNLSSNTLRAQGAPLALVLHWDRKWNSFDKIWTKSEIQIFTLLHVYSLFDLATLFGLLLVFEQSFCSVIFQFNFLHFHLLFFFLLHSETNYKKRWSFQENFQLQLFSLKFHSFFPPMYFCRGSSKLNNFMSGFPVTPNIWKSSWIWIEKNWFQFFELLDFSTHNMYSISNDHHRSQGRKNDQTEWDQLIRL